VRDLPAYLYRAFLRKVNLARIKRARLDPKGMGDTHPVADNGTEPGRVKNRRIEIVKIAGLATSTQ